MFHRVSYLGYYVLKGLVLKKYFFLFVCMIIFTGCATLKIGKPVDNPSPKITSWIAFWDWDRGVKSIQKNSDIITEIMPFWYDMDSTGNLFPSQGIPEMREQGLLKSMNEKKFVEYCHRRGIKVIPLISNEFNKFHVHEMLSNNSIRQYHLENIVNLVVENQYDGIDIDYEGMMKEDRNLYSYFLRDLAERLHGYGKILSVAVHAKVSEPGGWDSNIAHDYPAIGHVVDRVRIMAYDHHWSGGEPGCIQPLDWIEQIVNFAVTVIPPEKIYLGIGIYGIDWGSPKDREAMYHDAVRIARENKSAIQWDLLSKENWFTYTEESTYSNRTVWFQDGKSFSYRWDLVRRYKLGGISFWRIGGEDPQTWRIIRADKDILKID